MVSTTLATLATGQQQQQQHQQQTSGISNFQHHQNQTIITATAPSSTTSSLLTAQQSPERAATIEATNRLQYQQQQQQQQQQRSGNNSTQQQRHNAATTLATHYYNANSNSNRTAINVNGNTIDGLNESTPESNHNSTNNYYKRASTEQLQKYYNGKVQAASNGETSIIKQESAANTSPPSTAPAAAALNLSQSLLASSPQINEQISLLFPKCRPKHSSNTAATNSKDSNANANTLKEEERAETQHYPKGQKINGDLDKPINDNTNNYYRTVNIITQSPPPHSASSISSESLSSVTPRISTNPFLCNSIGATPEENEDHHHHHYTNRRDENSSGAVRHSEEDELPEPNYAPFYYHTSSPRDSRETTSPRDQFGNQNKHSRQQQQYQEEATKRINEMPRKRSQYDTRHHHEQQQQQTLSQQQYSNQQNHADYIAQPSSRKLEHSEQNGHHATAQNPFVKETYWDSRQIAHGQANNLLHSPEYSGERVAGEMETIPSAASHRRSQYQTEHRGELQQQQQQQHFMQHLSHHIRLGLSPNNSDPAQQHSSDVQTQKKNIYNTQQQQQQNQKLISEGLSAIQAQYLYGSKSSLLEQQNSQQPQHTQKQSDWTEKRERELIEKELIERELRQRDVKEKELRERDFREKEVRDYREKEIREKDARDREIKERELREREYHMMKEKDNSINERDYRERSMEKDNRHMERDNRTYDRERIHYEREREREQREQRSKTERYINAAMVRESVGNDSGGGGVGGGGAVDQTLVESRTDRRHQSHHHHQQQKYLQKHHYNATKAQQQQQQHQQQQQLQQQQQQQQQQLIQQHHQSGRHQLSDDHLIMTKNNVGYEDTTESWQNLRVTTDSSQLTNRSLAVDSKSQQHHFVAGGTSSPPLPSIPQQKQLEQYQQQQQQKVAAITTLSANSTTPSASAITFVNSLQKSLHASGGSSIAAGAALNSILADDKHSILVNSNDLERSFCRDRGDRKYISDKHHSMNVDSRHGIIEYEGSPRRIGQMANSHNDDLQPRLTNAAAANVANNKNSSAATNSAASNSPKQQPAYAARPGFPQRIISPQRDTVTATAADATTPPNNMIMNYINSSNNSKQLHVQQPMQQQQQQQSSPSNDNNGEDTSNDVSEIGTISDLTTPETISQQQQQQHQQLHASEPPTPSSTPPLPTAAPPQLSLRTLHQSSKKLSLDIVDTMQPVTAMTASSATKLAAPTTPTTSSSTLLSCSSISPTTTTVATSPLTMTPLTITNCSSITNASNPLSIPTKSSTFDYLYEFSETRKVLEEFFKCPSNDDKPIIENSSDVDSIDIQYEFHSNLGRDIDDDDDDDDRDVEGDVEPDDADDEDDIQLDVEIEADNENDNNEQMASVQQQTAATSAAIVDCSTTDELTPQHRDSVSSSIINKHAEQQQRQRHHYNHYNYRNHLQSPTQFSYRPYNESNDDDDDDEEDDDDAADNEHHQSNNGHSQRISQNHQNYAILNNTRHNSTTNSISSSMRSQQQQHHMVNNNSQAQQQQQLEQRLQQHHQRQRNFTTGSPLMRDFDFFLDSTSRSSCEQLDQQIDGLNHNQQLHVIGNNRQQQQQQQQQNNYRYSPETTDYDSNCGDLDSLSGDLNGGGGGGGGGVSTTSCSNYAAKYYASSMPVLEDGLSSGHTSDTENNNQQNNLLNQQNSSGIHHTPIGGGISMLMDMKRVSTNNSINSMNNITYSATDVVTVGGGGLGMAEKRYTTMSPNLLHDSYMRTTQMPTADSPTNGVLDDSGRDSVRSKHDTPRNEVRAGTTNAARELIGQSPNNVGISNNKVFKNIDPDLDSLYSISVFHRNDMVQMTPPPPAPAPHRKPNNVLTNEPDILQPTPYISELHANEIGGEMPIVTAAASPTSTAAIMSNSPNKLTSVTALGNLENQTISSATILTAHTSPIKAQTIVKRTAQPPPLPERNPIQQQQQQQQSLPASSQQLQRSPSPVLNSPVWLSRHLDVAANKGLLESSSENHSKNLSADEDDIDTDLETDRLLGHQRLDDQGYYDENKSWDRKPARSLLSKISPKQVPSTKTRNGYNALLSSTPEIPPPIPPKNSSSKLLDIGGSMSSPEHSDKSPLKSLDIPDLQGLTIGSPGGGSDASGCIVNKKDSSDAGGGGNSGNNSTASGNGVGNGSSVGSGGGSNSTTGEKKVKKSKNKEGGAVLIEGVLFRAKYLGSTQLVCEGQPTKSTRMMQAEEAVSRIKAPDGDVQPSTEVDLFISTEKIMVLNTDLKEIMMDHALRTISYIADIGDLVVLMARRRFVPQDIDDAPKPNRTPKMICHVFESDEAQFIAQSIGQAFQVAYMEFLKANGIEDHRFVKEMDYQEVLNSQEIFGDELEIFAKKELQKEVVVPKAKGEILGVVIVESGWGSMLPTVVIANLMSSGAAARCGQLNIGDQLIAINGLSLVGLPLSTCQTYIKNTKNQTVVKFTVVPCPPVVEVKIKRPETKYQLGFSVQNGVICSLLRGGIAERGGVRVGHRIIEINNQSVVAVPHEKIVNLLATSVGEILMKTMPTSMFRLLTGQENPIFI